MATKSAKNVSESDTNNEPEYTEPEYTETTPQAATPPDNKPPHDGVTSFVYVGPSLPGGRLKSNTVLSGTYAEITGYYKEAIDLFPAVARLFVPVSRCAESREKAEKSGNLINRHYQEIIAAITAKGDEQ